LYNNRNSEMREYELHDAPVNCISFCTWDPYKLFSTSHDGSVRCGDIFKRTFDVVSKIYLLKGSLLSAYVPNNMQFNKI